MIMSECMTLAFAVDLLLATQYDIIYHRSEYNLLNLLLQN